MSAHGDEEEFEGEGEESGREWLANKGGEEREQEDEDEEENDIELAPDTDGFEELKAAMEKHSGAPLYCDVCKVDCNSQESFDKHMVGKKHEKEVKKIKAKGGKVEEKKEEKPKEPKFYTKEDYDNYYEGSEYWCDVCEVECTGEDSWNAHMVGVKHKKKLQSVDCLKRIERSGEYYKYDDESQAYWCLTCDLEVTSPQVLEQHFKSQKHKQTLQECEPYFSNTNSHPTNWSRYQSNQNSYSYNKNSYQSGQNNGFYNRNQSGQNNGYYNRNSYHPDYREVNYDYRDSYEDSWQEDGDFWCYVCEIDCNSEENYWKHIEGKHHQKTIKEEAALKRLLVSGENVRKNKNGMFWCGRCKVEVSSAQILETHINSNKHLVMAGMMAPEPKGGRKPRFGGSGFGMGMGPPRRPFMDAPGFGGGMDRFGPRPLMDPRDMMDPRDRMDPRERMDPRDRMEPRDRLGPRDRDRYEEEMEPLYTRRGAAVAAAGSRAAVLVTNLHPCVSGEDLEELFCTIGKVVSARKIREGVAEVVFLDAENAYRAKEMFNNRPLDGQPMYVEFMPESGSTGESYGPRGGYGMSARDRLGGMGESAMDRLGPMGGGARDRLGPMDGAAAPRDRMGPMGGGAPRDRMGPMGGGDPRDRMGPMGGGARDRLGDGPMGGGARDRLGAGPMGGGARDRLGPGPMGGGARDRLGPGPMGGGARDRLGPGPMGGGARERAAPVGGRWGY